MTGCLQRFYGLASVAIGDRFTDGRISEIGVFAGRTLTEAVHYVGDRTAYVYSYGLHPADVGMQHEYFAIVPDATFGEAHDLPLNAAAVWRVQNGVASRGRSAFD